MSIQSNNYVDVKVTVWQRLHFSNHANMDEIVHLLKTTGNSNSICEDDLGFRELETLFDTELPFSPVQNNGDATIEVYSNNETIWSNDQ